MQEYEASRLCFEAQKQKYEKDLAEYEEAKVIYDAQMEEYELQVLKLNKDATKKLLEDINTALEEKQNGKDV
jgi:hypothetical protein